MLQPVLGQLRAPMSKVEQFKFRVFSPRVGDWIWLRGETTRTTWTQVWCGWSWVPLDDWESRPTYYRGQARRRGLI